MGVFKEIKDRQLYLYIDGNLIYKRWLDTGQSTVFHDTSYNRYKIARDLIYDYKDRFIIVKAKLKMKSTENGGRVHGFKSGYRPNHVFEYKDGVLLRTYIGDIIFEGLPTIEPGEEKIVTVRFLSIQQIEQYLNVGRRWFIHEANKCLGEAEIIEIADWDDDNTSSVKQR
jgi:hypothetical protein